jgi:hypothetical protein
MVGLMSLDPNLGEIDQLIIQDLLRLPESERHHACWLTEKLVHCIKKHGFNVVSAVQQGSRSGNAWFNLIAKSRLRPPPSLEESRQLVTSARHEQWKLWAALDQSDQRDLPDRPEIIAALDLDLQLTSLTRLLRNEGFQLRLDDAVARRMRATEFQKRVDAFVRADNLLKRSPEEHVHFRERGEQLNTMEAFLRSSDKLALVYGGPGGGKNIPFQVKLTQPIRDVLPVYAMKLYAALNVLPNALIDMLSCVGRNAFSCCDHGLLLPRHNKRAKLTVARVKRFQAGNEAHRKER